MLIFLHCNSVSGYFWEDFYEMDLFQKSFFSLVLQQGYRFYEKRNDGFKVSKISCTLPYHPDWEIGSSNLDNAKRILDQPFYYLSKGGQV